MKTDEGLATLNDRELGERLVRHLGPDFHWGGQSYAYVPTWTGLGRVVEAMEGRGFYAVFKTACLPGDGWPGDRCWAIFERHGWADTHPLWKAGADTVPRAACVAAILALEDDEEPDR